METVRRKIGHYITRNGKVPFEEWIHAFKGSVVEAIIESCLKRLSLGNFGDCRGLSDGVFELRIHYGPGYRVYFGCIGSNIVILLCGGDKRTQPWDIMRAKNYWIDYKERV